jgi:hypothetical protein
VQTRALARPRLSASFVVLTLAAIVAAGLVLSRVDYVPIWDGFEYATAINRGAANPDWAALRLSGHVSHAFAAVAIVVQSLAPGQYWPLLLTNALLFALAVVAFHRLVRLAFPSNQLAIGRALATGAFAAQPTILAAVVQPGLDLPLLPAFLWAAVFLIERRWAWAIVSGMALAFTKETGVLLYGVLVVSWAVTHPGLALGRPGSRRRAFARLVALLIPCLVFATYLVVRTRTAASGEAIAWGVSTPKSAWETLRQFIVPRIGRRLVSYSAVMLVMNFSWILTLGVLAAGLSRVRRARQSGEPVAAVIRSTPPTVRFVIVLTVGLGYALTRFSTFTNPRYLLPVVPLLLVLFVGALGYLGLRVRARELAIGGIAALMAVSAIRTVDPVSRLVFRTFLVGEHRMLWMTSITGECCGYGRDQLVYNLEFTNIARAADDALAATRPGDSTLIVVPDLTNWHVVPLIDARTGRRTLDASVGISPPVTETDSVEYFVSARRAAVYLDLPNGQPDGRLARLSRAADTSGELRVSRGGYAVSAYRLSLRAKARSAESPP